MPIHDFNAQRLFVEAPLAAGARIAASSDQANYLRNVLRMGEGEAILLFNGRDGEWRATLMLAGKRGLDLVPEEQVRPQQGGPDIHYLFAPLKRARLDYMVQKATEMGVARLCPVLTRHTIAERVNVERMRANAIEAAEQCGILRVPAVDPPAKLEAVLAGWDAGRKLIFCDEGTEVANPVEALSILRPPPPTPPRGGKGSPDPAGATGADSPREPEANRRAHSPPPCGEGLGVGGHNHDPPDQAPSPPRPSPARGAGVRLPLPLAVLIGPEGGFSPEEREMLRARPFTLPVSLGPRIMRADTAAIAALALVNAVLGDWR